MCSSDLMNSRIFLLKLVPGMNGSILDALIDDYDGVIIESFGVGGLPNYGDDSFYNAIERWMKAGKFLVMATQVTHEGSDIERAAAALAEVVGVDESSAGLPRRAVRIITKFH